MASNGIPEWLQAEKDLWTELRQRHTKSRIDLREVILEGRNLKQVQFQDHSLSFARFGGSHLTRCDFARSYLFRSDFIASKLERCELSKANLQESYFTRSTLTECKLNGADALGANFGAASLAHCNLSDARLAYANFQDADLSGSDLTHADLSRANLAGANLSNARIGYTNFSNVDLSTCQGLDTCEHIGPSALDHHTLVRSGPLPTNFLRGCGLSDLLIDYLPSIYSRPIEFYSCFISYSHADEKFAHRLHAQLQDQGIRCWLDRHQLLPGDDIYDQVQSGIKHWDKILLCCSESSLTSWWVDNEINMAFAKEQELMRTRKKKVIALIPLNLDGYLFDDRYSSGKKEQLVSRLAANFTDWEASDDRFNIEFERVLLAMRADAAARQLPPLSKL
jgi:uncharacterized protein YjbI with pentapeptide repeats